MIVSTSRCLRRVCITDVTKVIRIDPPDMPRVDEYETSTRSLGSTTSLPELARVSAAAPLPSSQAVSRRRGQFDSAGEKPKKKKPVRVVGGLWRAVKGAAVKVKKAAERRNRLTNTSSREQVQC